MSASAPINIPARLPKSPAQQPPAPNAKPAQFHNPRGLAYLEKPDLVAHFAALTLKSPADESTEKHSKSTTSPRFCAINPTTSTATATTVYPHPIAITSSVTHAIAKSNQSHTSSVAAATTTGAVAAQSLVSGPSADQKEMNQKSNHGDSQKTLIDKKRSLQPECESSINLNVAQKMLGLKVGEKLITSYADMQTPLIKYRFRLITYITNICFFPPKSPEFKLFNGKNNCPLLQGNSSPIDPDSFPMPEALHKTLLEDAQSYENVNKLIYSVRTRSLEYYPVRTLADAINYLENVMNVTSYSTITSRHSATGLINFSAAKDKKPTFVTAIPIIGIQPIKSQQVRALKFAAAMEGTNSLIQYITWNQTGTEFSLDQKIFDKLQPCHHILPSMWREDQDNPNASATPHVLKKYRTNWVIPHGSINECIYVFMQRVIPFSYSFSTDQANTPLLQNGQIAPDGSYDPKYIGAYSAIEGSQVLYVIYPEGINALTNQNEFLKKCETLIKANEQGLSHYKNPN